jgi:hypothetical protein
VDKVAQPDPSNVIGLTSLTADALESMVRKARHLGELGDRVSLDLTGLQPSTNARNSRVSIQWANVLSNLILGYLGTIPLAVKLPDHSSMEIQLARGGLFFALARHLDVTVTGAGATPDRLDRWRTDWQIAKPEQPQFEFPEPLDGEADSELVPVAMDRRILAFLNPQTVPSKTLHSEQQNTVYPWVANLIGTVPAEFVSKRERLRRDASRVIRELVDNVCDHSCVGPGDTSYVILSVTTGSRGESANRLYITVFDTGIGIPSSIQERMPYYKNEPALAVADALKGLERYGRDRGIGLPRIAKLAESRHGRVFLATSAEGFGGGTGSVVASVGQSLQTSAEVFPTLPIRGTIAVVTLPITTPEEIEELKVTSQSLGSVSSPR